MRKTPVLFFALFCLTLALAAAPPSKPKTKAAGSAQAAPLPSAAAMAMNSVNPERIRAHVKFLSDDLLEGRGTGQRGGDIAARYIADQFELDGLKPAGDNGTFLQKVPLVGITTAQGTRVDLIPSRGAPVNLKQSDEIVAMDESQKPISDIDSEILFVGYGIDAPEYKWNDYKDVDVRGKVLLMFVNEPPSDDPNFFTGKALTYYGRWTYKFEEAARKGAAGVILIHKTDMASYGWNVVQTSWSGERSYLREDKNPKLNLASWIHLNVAEKLVAAAGKDIDGLLAMAKSRDFRPVPIPVKIKAHIVSKIRPFDSANAVAIVPGSDPKLKDEAVLFTAHFDHLGIRVGMPGDNIYNGAIDNATGCALLMEMAHAVAAAKQKPMRSMIFVAVTGEEQGLLGSEFLGQHPPIPAAKIVLDLNFDGFAPIGVPEEVNLAGSERTSFYPVVEKTATEFKLAIVPDSNPGAGYFYRSDHFSMARVGVPAFSVSQGDKFQGKPLEFGKKFEKEYNEKHYHQPSDEYHADWDFAGNAKIARLGIALGWKAANLKQGITWKQGDEFEAARKASQAAAAKSGN